MTYDLDQEPADDAPTDLMFHGHVVGTSTGWDQWDTFGVIQMDAVLNDLGKALFGGEIPTGASLAFSLETDKYGVYGDDPEPIREDKINWKAMP